MYEVTIGIPVYNIEKYVPRMMDSVLAQTFRNIEILICDDCGTDNSIDIIRSYQHSHPRGNDIRIVRQPHNMGLGNGRNRLISEAQGKYIYFLDGDDSIMPNTIETLYEAIRKYNAEIVYGSHYRIEGFDSEEKVFEMKYPSKQFFKEDEFANYAYQDYGRMFASTWNFLIDIDIYKKNGIKYKSVNFWEDFTTTIDLPTYITRAVLLPDFTYNYYCRYGTLSNFQKRNQIDKDEILKTIGAMEMVKADSDRMKGKPYFSGRMYKVMMTCFYMACAIIKQRNIINPSFSDQEIRNIMHSPLSMHETLNMKDKRIKNMILYFLGILPPMLSVFVIRIFGKYKGLT